MKKIKLDEFLQAYNSISYVENRGKSEILPYLQHFFEDYGGLVIYNGWYRIHTIESMQRWTPMLQELFPNYPGYVLPIGFDWLGRHYGMDAHTGSIIAFCVEFEKCEFYYCNIEQFHNEYLVKNGRDLLSLHSYRGWQIDEGGFEFDECLAWKVSFIEGGENEWENFRREKMWGYWERVKAIREAKIKEQIGEMAPSGSDGGSY